jgi:hypothetical protein
MAARTWSTEFKQFILRGNVLDLRDRPVRVRGQTGQRADLAHAQRSGRTPDPSTRKCPECLSEIPIEARRCSFCTVEVGPGEAPEAATAA